MSKETPKDDRRQQSDHASHKQTDKPWNGNPEKEQRNDDAEIDLEKWHETKNALIWEARWQLQLIDARLVMHGLSNQQRYR